MQTGPTKTQRGITCTFAFSSLLQTCQPWSPPSHCFQATQPPRQHDDQRLHDGTWPVRMENKRQTKLLGDNCEPANIKIALCKCNIHTSIHPSIHPSIHACALVLYAVYFLFDNFWYQFFSTKLQTSPSLTINHQVREYRCLWRMHWHSGTWVGGPMGEENRKGATSRLLSSASLG